MGGKNNAPDAPNYAYLGQQQEIQQENLNQQQSQLNHSNSVTPFGTTAWNFDPSKQQWTGTQSLNPTLQSTLDTQEQSGLGAAHLGQQEVGQAGNLFNGEVNSGLFNPIDYSNVGSVKNGNYYDPKAQQAVWNEFQTMQQPLQQQQMEGEESQLQAQGLRQGDAAYDNAIRNLSNTQYQQQQSAQDQAVLAGEQEAQAMQGMDVQAQQANLGADNAMKQGQMNLFQGLMPSQSGIPTATTLQGAQTAGVQAPDMMRAAEDQYGSALNSANARNAGTNNLFQGILGIASMALAPETGGASLALGAATPYI